MKVVTTRVISVLAILAIGMASCEKQDEPCTWVTFSPSDMGFSSSVFNGFLATDTSGGIYAIQVNLETDAVEYAYKAKGGNWVRTELFDDWRALNHTTSNDVDGTVWLLSEAYLFHMRDGEIIEQYEISNPTFTTAYNRFVGVCARAGRVWLLHGDDGLHELMPETGQLVHYPDTSASEDYIRLAADDFGNVWVSKDNYYNGLMHLTPAGDWEYIDRSDPFFDCSGCIPGYEEDYMYATRMDYGLDNQLYLLRHTTAGFFVTDLYNLQGSSLVKLEQELAGYGRLRTDKMANPWLYGNSDGSVTKYENGTLTTMNIGDAYGTGAYTTDLQWDIDGNLWIANANGVAVYNENGVEF